MFRLLIALLLLVGSISGCSLFNKENKNNSEEKVVEPISQDEEKEKEEDDKVKENDPDIIEETDEDGLKAYRPKIGLKKIFIDHENVQSLTEDVVFENGDYVQSIITIGQSASVVIYKWTENEISIVETIQNPDDPDKNYLEGINEETKQEVMISKTDSLEANWKVISQNETVQTPYQTFTNVYVIQKITNEVEGADTIYSNYIAPGVGLIKETFEVTGEQGYSAESLLQKIEE
ncbi:hypothetical protein V7075_10490 [Neobacillus drentensis]|uniref:hypothetical protein n=1 Tax=Neobacillus drentensis TaxID=220684 RepID=UPI0030000005